MANGNSVHDEIKEQHKKLKDMTFGEKIRYIWGYYKIPIGLTLFFLLFIGILAYQMFQNNYKTVCYIAVVDGQITDGSYDSDALSVGFKDYLGIDGRKKRIDIDYGYTLIEQEFDEDAYISYDKIYTLASTHSMDGYLAEQDYIGFFSSDQEIFLADLRDILSEEELEILDEYLVYYTLKNGTKIPYAVNISNAPVIKSCDLTMKNPCYGVVVTSYHYDEAANFIRYVFNLEKK